MDAVTSPSLPTSAIPAPLLPGAHGVEACPRSTEQPQLCSALQPFPDALHPEISNAPTCTHNHHWADWVERSGTQPQFSDWLTFWPSVVPHCSLVVQYSVPLYFCLFLLNETSPLGMMGQHASIHLFPSRVHETSLFNNILLLLYYTCFYPVFPLLFVSDSCRFLAELLAWASFPPALLSGEWWCLSELGYR